MSCSVYGCNNQRRNAENGFHCFFLPKNKQIQKKWVIFCRRQDKFNIATARICSDHFTPNDFANKLKYDMGFVKHLKLKEGAFPTIYKNSDVNVQRVKRYEARQRRELVSKILTESARQEIVPAIEEEPSEQVIEVQIENKINSVNDEIVLLKREILKLKMENFKYAQEIKNVYLPKIERLAQEWAKAKYQNDDMEQKLGVLFTKGQIEKLKNGEKRQNWTDEDIKQSKALYSMGTKSYIFLRRKRFPLPSVRTLQMWAKKTAQEPNN